MKVTIVVPIYGVEKYIERCVRSLFEQTYDNIEYLFVNDCSKDKSISLLNNIIQEYPSKKNDIIIVNHKNNRGLAAARNTGIENATGDFIIHVDSDDYVELKMVEKLVKHQQETNADIVNSNYYKYHKSYKELVSHLAFDSSYKYCISTIKRISPVCIWGRLIRRSLYIDNDIRTVEGSNMGEDYQVITRLMYYAKNIANVDDFLYHYDCSNIGSYSNVYSLSKNSQSWNSFDVVRNFFKDKDIMYNNAVTCAELQIIVAHLIISSKIPNVHFYYENAINRLKNINSDFYKILPLSKRIILLCANHYSIMKAYIVFTRSISHLFKSIKK